jgi:hypothetical protein
MGAMRILPVLAVIVCLLPSSGLCGEQPVLVLFGLEDPHGVLDWKVRRALTGRLAGLLCDCGHELVEPAEIQQRLKNRFPPGRLPHKRTAIARSLGAWATVVTRVQRTGGGCRLEVFLYNLKSSSAEKTNRVKAACDQESLAEALPELAGPLCEHLKAGKIEPPPAETGKKPESGAGLEGAVEEMARLAAPEAEVETRAIGRAAAGKPVRVSIVTDPEGASVWWDGSKVGQTPLRIEPVEPGWHRLVLEAPGCVPLKESLKVQGSIEMKVGLFLRQRRVRVLTNPPGAEVTVDGKLAGTSPVLLSLKAKQTHRLVARLDNHREAFYEFKPKPATRNAPPLEVTVELEAQPVYVMVDVHPPEARVEIGTGEKQEHIVGSGTVGIVPGRRKVIARLEGYVTVEREVEFIPGKSAELKLRLKPIPGYTDTRSIIRSKRIQAFAALGLSAATFSVVWPLLKWSADSEMASDEWTETAERTSDPIAALKARIKSGEMDDRAEWTAIAGYAALGVGIVSLGWSLYSFLSCPDDPQTIRVAPARLPGGGQLVFWGRF